MFCQPTIKHYDKPYKFQYIRKREYKVGTVHFGSSAQKVAEVSNLSKFAEKSSQIMEGGFRDIEFVGRKAINSILAVCKRSEIDNVYNALNNIDKNSEDFIGAIVESGSFFGQKKEVEINLESERIQRLVNSNEASIFIMNHDSQKHDPELLGLFNAIFYNEYINAEKAKSCPRPCIILNEDILLSMTPKLRAIFQKLGAVGIDASISKSKNGSLKNAKQMISLVKDFCQDKVNIFIFPEGKKAVLKNLDFDERFQDGIANIVKIALSKRDRVKIVPVGFAHNTKAKEYLGSIYVGRSILFKKEADSILVSAGNITPNSALDKYSKYFYGNLPKTDETTYYKGYKATQLEGKDEIPSIKNILCENLRICRDDAIKALPKESDKGHIIEL